MHLRFARLAAALVLLAPAAPATQAIDYALAFEPGGGEWRVEARMAGRGEEQVHFWIPLWTPGAYHVAEYGRFVRELRASDGRGRSLTVERDGTSHFVVRGSAGAEEIVLAYEAEPISSGLFSHGIIDVESNRLTSAYAFVNPVSLFGFVPERADEPVRLAVTLPDGWRAATVLAQDEQGRYLAPSYLRFEDSPLLFSPKLETRTFEVDGLPHAVSVHGKEGAEVDALAAGCKRIVEAGSQLMRGLPYDRYHFLYAFVPEAGGSGLEHSFSTLILLAPRTEVGEGERGLWGITAHEYFHLWCAERIHVEEIRAPDLTRPLQTGTIWVNEGITEYFCRHLLRVAGFLEEEELLASYLENRLPRGALPAQSWTDVSRAATRWEGMGELGLFAARMYAVGPPTIFALDMTMRRATEGERGVLDLLHHLDTNYARRGRGFTEDELDDVLGSVGGAPAAEFYARYIDGDELPDPTQYLDVLGYRFEAGALSALSDASEAQLRARRDYFSPTGQP
jgi:predicted metalloprotease with PDZ domain